MRAFKETCPFNKERLEGYLVLVPFLRLNALKKGLKKNDKKIMPTRQIYALFYESFKGF